MEAYSPRNETIVTLIRDKKKFEFFTPNDVLGRILTFDMQREEANERKKLGELQAKLDGMKITKLINQASKALQASPRSTSKLQQVSQKQSSKSKSK